MVALTIVLFMAMRLPVVGVLAVFVLPAPLVILAIQNGMGAMGLGLLGTGLLLSFTSGPVSVLGWLPFGTISLVLALGYKLRFTLKSYLLFGCIAYCSVFGFLLAGSESLTGINPMKELETLQVAMADQVDKQMVQPARAEREKLFQEYQALTQQVPVSIDVLDQKKRELDQARQREDSSAQMVRQWRDMTKNPLPILIFAGLLYLILVIKVLHALTARLAVASFPAVEFSRWKCPTVLTWLFLLYLVSSPWWNPPREPGVEASTLTSVALGLFVVMQLLYFVFGLSLLLFLSGRWNLPTPLKVVMMTTGILFAQIVMLIGIFDSFFDLRNTDREATKEGV